MLHQGYPGLSIMTPHSRSEVALTFPTCSRTCAGCPVRCRRHYCSVLLSQQSVFAGCLQTVHQTAEQTSCAYTTVSVSSNPTWGVKSTQPRRLPRRLSSLSKIHTRLGYAVQDAPAKDPLHKLAKSLAGRGPNAYSWHTEVGSRYAYTMTGFVSVLQSPLPEAVSHSCTCPPEPFPFSTAETSLDEWQTALPTPLRSHPALPLGHSSGVCRPGHLSSWYSAML